MRYAFMVLIYLTVVAGAYFAGYGLGSMNKTVEYVVREKEVVKYVEKKKAQIYSAPVASRDNLIQLFNNSQL